MDSQEPLLILFDVAWPPNPKSTKPPYPSEKNVMYDKNLISLVIAGILIKHKAKKSMHGQVLNTGCPILKCDS